jgi:hypothetical protein
MSQAGILKVSSGSLPPQVPTTFTTNSGTAVPVANNLNIFGIDSSANNDNGVFTNALGDTVNVVLSNRSTSVVSTANATPTTALTLSLGATPGVYFIEGNIVAFNTIDIAGGAYSFTSGMRTDGATATELGTEFKDSFEEAAMAPADFNIIASGNNVIVEVIGIAGKSIDWNVYLTYRFVS